ncbi:MAG: hypothetical protein AAFY71_12330 [Bacteroidota bacterium]
MKHILAYIFIFLSVGQMAAQNFPQDWAGVWTGQMQIWQMNQVVTEFAMKLEISPTDSSWNYIITYKADSDTPDVRTYSLISINDTIGHYGIDEHNSIVLDSYLIGNCLFTHFSGMQTDLQTRVCMHGDHMEYEISYGPTKEVRQSGGTVIEQDTILSINSYAVTSLMKASLKRE